MDGAIAGAVRRLARAERVVVLTGAGISKESGIPTFREAQEGLWARYDPMQMASLDGFLGDPKLVWEWYDYRFGMVEAAQPNAGHRAIARARTGDPRRSRHHAERRRAAPAGRLDDRSTSCTAASVVTSAWAEARGFTRGDLAGLTGIPPRCPQCGDLLRPDVVWFGEYLPAGCDGRGVRAERRVRRHARRRHVWRRAARGFAAVASPSARARS